MSMHNVIGQERVANILINGLKYKKIAHAYIFAGPKGVGKEKMALEFAKALNCTSDSIDACNNCESCKRIDHLNNNSVVWIEPETNSIKIEQIRALQKNSYYKNGESHYRVLIIKNAELMTNQAANSILKFLEEPTPNTVIILLVENKQQLLLTIKSRCQILNFSLLSPSSIVDILKDEGYKEIDILIASNLTQDILKVKELISNDQFVQMRNIMIKWNEDLKYNHYQALISVNDRIVKNDYIKERLPQFLDLLILWYRDILNIKLKRQQNVIYKGFEELLIKHSQHITIQFVMDKIEAILLAKDKISSHVNPQLALEEMVLAFQEG